MHHAKTLRRVLTVLMVLSLAAVAAGEMRADEPAAEAKPPEKTEAAPEADRTPPGAKAAEPGEPTPIVYQPPKRGAPRLRVAGGVRRASTALPVPLALAPEHVGETVSQQPSLFWHLDAAPAESVDLMFTLIEADAVEPLIEVVLPVPAHSGVQRIRLEDYDVQLRPGVEYEWSVAVVPDTVRRGGDVISGASIRRVFAPAALSPAAGANTYAALGLWYDALESLSDGLDAAPADPTLRGQRDSLLRQARLDAAL